MGLLDGILGQLGGEGGSGMGSLASTLASNPKLLSAAMSLLSAKDPRRWVAAPDLAASCRPFNSRVSAT